MLEKLPRRLDRAMASFIVDDVAGQSAEDAQAFSRFAGWVADNGLRGECSAIAGLHRDDTGRALPFDQAYGQYVNQYATVLDAYMEVMTHQFLYDFAADRMPESGPHEGVWLMTPGVSEEAYYNYFRAIARRADDAGFRIAGLTLPGCGCEACVAFKKNKPVRSAGVENFNANVMAALLRLIKDGLTKSAIMGLFVGTTSIGPATATCLIEDAAQAVYDIPPGVSGDWMARWENDARYINVDHYVTEGGAGGRLPQLLRQQSETLIYYGHWQGLRPDRGVGHAAFKEVARRLNHVYADEITWMRPTEIAAYRHVWRHTEVRELPGENAFALSLPFATQTPLSFRLRGRADVTLRSPSGQLIVPVKKSPAEAWAIFDFVPENGAYRISMT